MPPAQFQFLGFGHHKEIERKPNNSDTRKCKEGSTVPGMDDNDSGERSG
jgi:hypothetical protein